MSAGSCTWPLNSTDRGRFANVPSSRKRKTGSRISAACEACKSRKAKCTGGPPPCQLCETLSTECIIDLSRDKRRRVALQRSINESKTYQDTLNRLVHCIQSVSSTQLDGMVQMIRSKLPTHDVLSTIRDTLQTIDEQDMPTLSADTYGSLDFLTEGRLGHLELDMTFGDTPRTFTTAPAATTYTPRRTADNEHRASDQLAIPSIAWDKAKLREGRSGSRPLSQFLSKLRASSDSEAEQLFRLILQFGDHTSAAHDAHDQPSSEFSRGTLNDLAAMSLKPSEEPAKWHPSLQPRSSLQSPISAGPLSPVQDTMYSAWQLAEAVVFKTDPETEIPQKQSNLAKIYPEASDLEEHPEFATSVASTVQSFGGPYIETGKMSISPAQDSSAHNLCVAQLDLNTRLRIPIHLVQPLIISDDAYLSRAHTDFYRGARQMIAHGTPVVDVIGTGDDVVVDLIFRNRSPGDKFDCCSWASEISSKSLPDADQFVKLAVAYVLAEMMRWMVLPSLATYTRIPDMMKPTPVQCMVPHTAAAELMPMPVVRDAIILRPRDWLSAIMEADWSVNWPFSLEEALQKSSVTGSRILTSKFIAHVNNPNNWSVNSSFLKVFPEVAGRILIHD